MFKLTTEQLKEYRDHMEETIKKATKEDHIIHGHMLYQCVTCEKFYIMNLERGLEDPTYEALTGEHKPVPFSFLCPNCGGNVFHIGWGNMNLGKNYCSYREMTDDRYLLVFKNFFWNDPESKCGVPVVFGPDAIGYGCLENEECSPERHVARVPLEYFTKEMPDQEGDD